MTKHIDTVIGLEMHATGRHYTFEFNICENRYEVLLLINGKPRRMATCDHKNDADAIVDALRYARENGVI